MAAQIPTVTRGIDVFSLPLNPKEGFVLSRVDGVSSVEDISIMVGLKLAELLGVLDRLAELGAVQLSWRAAKVAMQPSAANGNAASAPAAANSDGVDAVQRVFGTTALYDQSELDVPAEISIELKKLILTGYYGIEGKDYYQLLGVARSADKKEVRAAYFELSRLFHPDSLFGRELGSFKERMVAVFKRLTEAYEVLGRSARRKEYDEYLASTMTTSALQQTLDQAPIGFQSPTSAPPQPQDYEGFPLADESPATPSASAPAAHAGPPTLFPPPTPEARREASTVVRPPVSREDRKAQLRERLRRSLPGAGGIAAKGAPSSPASPTPPTAASRQSSSPSNVSATERRDSAIKGLRGLRQTGQNTGGVDPILALLRKARDAEQAGDLLAAASALQGALALQPHQKDLQLQYARVSKAVTRSLADNYEKQARYEEKQGKWAAAASSWERVSEGRPEEAHPARAAAEALLRAPGDLHKAQRLAQRAVDAAPSDVTNVVVLARVLLAAGLRLNARRELEKAVKLDPQNEMIKNLLREAR